MATTKKLKEQNQQTTISIKPSVRQKFQEKVGKRHVSEKIEELMLRALDPARPTVSDMRNEDESAIADILALTVSEWLGKNREWAQAAARRAHLQLPSGLILRDRIFKHYMKDKQHLGSLFSEWLKKRFEYWLDQGVDLDLFLDAGSSVLWFALEFWPRLWEITKQERWRGGSVRIYTNNLAVAELYVHECEVDESRSTEVSCELLGGWIDYRYAALTGETVEDRIKVLSASGRKRISILAGNYIRVRASSAIEPTSVRPLVRGLGQRAVKSLYASADETYILGCIGKLWTGTTDEINRALATNQSTGIYEEVSASEHPAARLVTTIRTVQNAILKNHSNSVHGMLGAPPLATDESARADFKSIPHFCYPYDDPIKNLKFEDQLNLKFEDQLKVEFPHKEARVPDFLKHYGITI